MKKAQTDHMFHIESWLKAKIFNEFKTEPVSKELKEKGKILVRD